MEPLKERSSGASSGICYITNSESMKLGAEKASNYEEAFSLR
jgi:hypothetical protein